MSTDTAVLSNVWWPFKTEIHAWNKALAVYLNSSIGLLDSAGNPQYNGRQLGKAKEG